MRIGELARRTGTTPRLLRYYEEQGLITSARGANGYRDFDEACVDRVRQIRGLLDSGLPTRIQWELPAGWKAGEIEWPFCNTTTELSQRSSHTGHVSLFCSSPCLRR